MTNLKIVGLGGTGANILYSLKEYIDGLGLTGDGIANIEYSVIDTSDANKHKAEAINANFCKLEDTKIGGREVVGSGTIRGENLEIIKSGVTSFLNSTGMFEDNKGSNFILLVHSASGATGSVAAPIIVDEFLRRDANFATITIGDSSTLHVTSNTLDTLQTMHNLSKKHDKNISMLYRDNAIEDTISSINLDVSVFMFMTSIFVSGKNEQLDPADMAVFFKPHMLNKKFGVPSGVSLIDLSVGAKDMDDNYVVTRVLGDNNDMIIDVPSVSNRQGVILDKNLLEVLNEDALPIVLHSSVGKLGVVMKHLNVTKSSQAIVFDDDDIETTDDEMVF
jgi:hypothetical protein